MEYAKLIQAGVTHQEAQEWQKQETRKLLMAGVTPADIDKYWGIGAAESPQNRAAYMANKGRYAQSDSLVDNFLAGWNMSSTGLMINNKLPEDNIQPKGFGANLAYGFARFAGDLPAGIVGAAAGSAIGGGTVGAPSGGTGAPMGAIVGAGVGAGALPEAIRQVYITGLRSDEYQGADDWIKAVLGGAWETAKAGIAGGVAGPAGAKAGKVVGGATGSRGAAVTADLVSQGLSELTVMSTLNLQLPTAEDFATAAVITVAAGGVTHLGTKRNGRIELSDEARRVQANLQQMYVETGIPPRDLAERARTDKVFRQVIMRQDVRGNALPPVGMRVPDPDRPKPVQPDPLRPDTMPPRPNDYSPAAMARRAPIPPNGNLDQFMQVMGFVEHGPVLNAQDDRAVSPAGARGRFQIMPDTARQYGFDPAQLFNPAYNEKVARAIAADLHNRYRGDMELMLAAYNAGPGRANRLQNEGPGTRLVAIPDKSARNGIRYEQERAARNEANLPLETQKYLANSRRKYGGELPGSRGGDGTFLAALPPPPPGGSGGGSGGDGGGSGGGLPDWATYRPPATQDDGAGGGKPPDPPEPPGKDFWERADDESLAAEIRRNFADEVKTPNGFSASDALRLWVSELEPARKTDSEFLRDNPEFDRDRDILAEDMVRLTYSSDARASIMLREGGVDAITLDVNRESPTLLKAAEAVKKAGGNMDEWFAFMAAERANNLEARGIQSGFDTDKTSILTGRKSMQKKYAEGTRILNDARKGLLEYGRDSGLFSQAQIDTLFKLDPVYVSYRRAMGGDTSHLGVTKSRLKGKKPIKTMEGSDRQIMDPKLTVMDNFYAIVRAADRNRAVGHFVAMAEGKHKAYNGFKQIEWNPNATFSEKPGAPFEPYSKDAPALGSEPEAFIAERAKKGLSENQFVYYRDGKAELWEATTPELAQLIKGVETRGEANVLDKTMTGIAAVARAGIVFAPDFAVKVSMVDQIQAFVTDPLHPPPFVTPIRGLLHALGGRADAEFLDWMAKGGAGASLASMDANYIKRDLHKIFESTGVFNATWNTVSHPLELAQIIHERVDAASRIGHKKLGQDKGRAPIKAALGSRKAYLDFAEAGTLGLVRAWSRWVPFLRPSILGTKQTAEALFDPSKGIKRPATTAMYLGLGVVLPSIAFYILNREQDKHLPEERQYKNKPDWEKDMFFITPEIAGMRFKLRKPHIIGVASGALTERFLEHLETKDPEAYKGLVDSMMKDVIPPLLPPATVAPLEQATGHDFFTGRSLIPASLEGASGPMQYTEATSEVGKKLARILGPGGADVMEFSPIVFDNYVREWSGTIGYDLLKALDKPLSPPNTGRPTELEDNPFVRGFLARNPRRSAAPIQEFYDLYHEFQTAARDKGLALKRRDEYEIDQYVKDPRAYVRMNNIAEALALQAEIIQGIYNNPDLTVDEKRQQTDNLYSQMIDTSRMGVKMMRQVKEAAEDDDDLPTNPALEGAGDVPEAAPRELTPGLAQAVGRARGGSLEAPPIAAPGSPSIGDPLTVPTGPR